MTDEFRDFERLKVLYIGLENPEIQRIIFLLFFFLIIFTKSIIGLNISTLQLLNELAEDRRFFIAGFDLVSINLYFFHMILFERNLVQLVFDKLVDQGRDDFIFEEVVLAMDRVWLQSIIVVHELEELEEGHVEFQEHFDSHKYFRPVLMY